MTLSFDRSLPAMKAGFGMIAADDSERGDGTVIEHNAIRHVLDARGIFLGGVAGVTVRRNRLSAIDCGGIVVHEDLSAFPTGPARNITIDSNIVKRAIYAPEVGAGAVAGIASIFVLSTGAGFDLITGSPNANVIVTNNTILNSGRGAIWLGNTAGGTVQGNTIANISLHPEHATWGVSSSFTAILLNDYTQAIATRYSSGVDVSNNIY